MLTANGPQTPDCCCKDQNENDVKSNEDGAADDVEFVKRVIEQTVLDSQGRVDEERVYLTGHQDGCVLAMAYAATYSDEIAGVACFDGTMVTPIPTDGFVPTPIWHLHGTMANAFPNHKEAGSHGAEPHGYIGAMESNDYWGQANHCQKFDDYDLMDMIGLHGSMYRYSDCEPDKSTAVELLSIIGGDDGNGYPYTISVLEKAMTIDMTAIARGFLMGHSSANPSASETQTTSLRAGSPRTDGTSATVSLQQEEENSDAEDEEDDFRTNCDFGPDALADILDGVEIPQKCIETLTGTRCYYIYVPECADEKSPLVLDVHGYNSCPKRMAGNSGWIQQATRNCFVVVWPTVRLFETCIHVCIDHTTRDHGL